MNQNSKPFFIFLLFAIFLFSGLLLNRSPDSHQLAKCRGCAIERESLPSQSGLYSLQVRSVGTNQSNAYWLAYIAKSNSNLDPVFIGQFNQLHKTAFAWQGDNLWVYVEKNGLFVYRIDSLNSWQKLEYHSSFGCPPSGLLDVSPRLIEMVSPACR